MSAHTLFRSILQSETIVGHFVLENLSCIMLLKPRILQTNGLDLVGAMYLVNDMIPFLSALRSSAQFAQLFEAAKFVVKLVGIKLTKP